MCKHNIPHITGQGETGQVSCVSPSRTTHGPFPPIQASGGVPRNFPVLIRTQQTEEATVQSKTNQRFLPGKEPQGADKISGSECPLPLR